MEENKIYVALYGSLRKGEYNYDRFIARFGEQGLKYIETYQINGFDLYSLGSYPGIKKSESPASNLTIDVMECNFACFSSINNMELGAGYSPEIVEIDGYSCTIYVYNYPVMEMNKVKNGNWSDYLRNKKFNEA